MERDIPERPDNEERKEEEEGDAAVDISRLFEALRIVSGIFVCDIFVITVHIQDANRSESPPPIACVMEDGDTDRDNGSGTDTSNASVKTWICLTNRSDVYSSRELFGESQLREDPVLVETLPRR